MEDSEDPFDHSLSVVKALELFPGRKSFDKDVDDLELPFEPLFGEFPEYLGVCEEGVVAASNLRLCIRAPNNTITIPLGLIDSVEVRDLSYLFVLCKDARTIRLTFSTNDICLAWHRRLFRLTTLPGKKEEIFAYCFRAYCSESSGEGKTLHTTLSTANHLSVPDPDVEAKNGNVPRQYPSPAPSIHFTSYKALLEFEIKRMGFDMGGPWKISNVNADYSMCSTYPPYLLIPGSINDDLLCRVAGYRSYGRVPNVVWRHSGNGAVIARCSQPQVGILGWRCNEDEDLIKALGDACAYDPGPHPTPMPRSRHSSALAACPEELPVDDDEIAADHSVTASVPIPKNTRGGELDEDGEGLSLPGTGRKRLTTSSSYESDLSASINVPFAEACEVSRSSPSSLKDFAGESRSRRVPRVLIVDARSFSAAIANRGRGGGYECPEYYPNCDIQYMSLANIHTISKSFQSLRQLCYSSSQDPVSWFSGLESSKWMTHLSALLKSAVGIVRTIASEGRPVLIHCSDGWDRTPQLVALAELMMDPYYRRLDGFQVLIEREWLAFGHKFGDRCGQGYGPNSNAHNQNERCPIFSQWLDCVYQLMRQFPTAFQFNSNYLVNLLQHVYSNVFGTFLFNSMQERQQNCVAEQTYSIWSYLQPAHGSRFLNPLYCPSDHQTLYPSWNVRDLVIWPVYLPGKDSPPPLSFPLSTPAAPKPVVATPAIPIGATDSKNSRDVTPNLSDSSRSELSDGDGVESAVEAKVTNALNVDANCSVNSATTDEFSDLADAVDEGEKGQFDDDQDSVTNPPDSGLGGNSFPHNADIGSMSELCPSMFPLLPARSSPKENDAEHLGSANDLMRTSITSTSTAYAPASETQCPICFRRRDPGVAVDDSVLDRIDFVCRSKTDPEHQREQSCRALVDEIAALKLDLARTRLELNRCRNLNNSSNGMSYSGSVLMNGIGADKVFSNGHARFPKSEPSSSSNLVGAAGTRGTRVSVGNTNTSTAGRREPATGTNSNSAFNSGWVNVTERNVFADDFDSDDDVDENFVLGSSWRATAPIDSPRGPRRGISFSGSNGVDLTASQGFCRTASNSSLNSGSAGGASPGGSFRSRRPSSASKNAKFVQPVHT